MRRILEFFRDRKKKAQDDKVFFRALGMVYDLRPDDWVELEFKYPDNHLIIHNLHLPGHNLRIGQFVTVEYRRGK